MFPDKSHFLHTYSIKHNMHLIHLLAFGFRLLSHTQSETIAKLMPTIQDNSFYIIFSVSFRSLHTEQWTLCCLLFRWDAHVLRLRYKIVSCGFRSSDRLLLLLLLFGVCFLQVPRRQEKTHQFVCLPESHESKWNFSCHHPSALRIYFSPFHGPFSFRIINVVISTLGHLNNCVIYIGFQPNGPGWKLLSSPNAFSFAQTKWKS